MGMIILNTAVTEQATTTTNSAIENAATAGLQCLEQVAPNHPGIGVLIYAGVFRDDNIMEPSVASLVQKELQLGLDFKDDPATAMIFSFDIINGANSVLNAITVANSILQNHPARTVLIVAGDAHPSKSRHPQFPFVAMGAAMLLGWDSDPNRGFQPVSYFSNCNESASAFSATGKLAEFADQGRSHGQFAYCEDYTERYLALSQTNINRYLSEQTVDCIDFLLGSEPTQGFCQQLRSFVPDLVPAQAVNLFDHYQGDVHSAAPIAAFHLLNAELANRQHTTLLFSTVGSGDASACALYRV